MLGAALLLFYSVISYAVLKIRLREAVRIGPEVWESDRIDTAFVLGYVRPRIYLPMRVQGIYRELMLLHERCHLKRLDHWLKLFGFVTLAVHWFNPLVWLAYVMLCWDAEFACDELVIIDMDLEQRKCYSAALLACSSKVSFPGASLVAFGEKPIKRRIRAVLRYRKPTQWVTVLAILSIIAVAVCFMTNPAA
jgi:beta-lactamase regulating signal transducer with metallopeptidase domain